MSDRVRSYEHGGFTVEYDATRCIHAAECVRGLPLVFDPDRRPWIDASQADADAIAAVVRRCPTGALRYRHQHDSPREAPDSEVTIEIVPGGPLWVRGDLRVTRPDGETEHETRVALCRCGASRNKPFCDNSHVAAGFDDPGAIADAKLRPTDGPSSHGADITPSPNGPLLVKGALQIIGAAGPQVGGGRAALCRCGASANKPFCDGSHNRIGFEAG